MKYIPADKLIAEIERQQRRLALLSNAEQVDMRRDCALQNGVYDSILNVIDSLQQEQPEGTEKQKPVVQWPNLSNCKHDCKTCFAKCFYRKEQNKEQQPEVDLNLEREIQLWLTKLRNRPTSDELRVFATHFYELGLNARKGE